jgi:hypothetical protein
MTRVEICGLGFSGSEIPEGGLTFSELIDWDGVPGTRGDSDPIPSANGSYQRTSIVRMSRAISVNAAILADSPEEYIRVRQRVEALPAQGEMRADLGDGYWSRHVEVQAIKIPDARAGAETEFTIDLIAPDPVRYSEMLTVGPVGLPVREGGLVLPAAFPWNFGKSIRPVGTVANTGALPIYPRMILSSSIPDGDAHADGVTVHGGPQRVSFGAFSGTLIFDSRDRRAWLNGVDVTRQVIRRDWPVVAPGVSADFFFVADEPSPDLVLTVEYRIGVW